MRQCAQCTREARCGSRSGQDPAVLTDDRHDFASSRDAIHLDVATADGDIGMDRCLIQAGGKLCLAISANEVGERLREGVAPGDVRADVLVEEHVMRPPSDAVLLAVSQYSNNAITADVDEPSVGRVVQWARKRAGITQDELAHTLNIPQSTIARIEAGRVVPRTATLIAILRATGHQLTAEPMDEPVDRELIRRQLALSVPRRTKQALGRAARDRLSSPIRMLRPLRQRQVPFVLIGDLAEAAHGAPIKVGREIEVVHATTRAATEQLARALEDVGATASDKRGLKTALGWLRLLTESPAGDDYDVLARTAVGMPVDSGVLVRVASIDDLIRIRRATRTPEDASAAAVLTAIAGEAMTMRG